MSLKRYNSPLAAMLHRSKQGLDRIHANKLNHTQDAEYKADMKAHKNLIDELEGVYYFGGFAHLKKYAARAMEAETPNLFEADVATNEDNYAERFNQLLKAAEIAFKYGLSRANAEKGENFEFWKKQIIESMKEAGLKVPEKSSL